MDRYSNLFNEIVKTRPKSILEIGTWNGNHAKKMIELAQRYVKQKHEISYYGFDLFEDFSPVEQELEYCPKKPATLKEVEKKLHLTGGKIHLVKGNTNHTLWNVPNIPFVDFIFLDGGHSLETIDNDWLGLLQFVHKDTVILLDDYYINKDDVGCKKLVSSLEGSNQFKVEKLNPIDLCNLGTQMVKVTLSP